jgi:hypothetical protein
MKKLQKEIEKKEKMYFKLTKCDQWSISSTFYKQLLRAYILLPKNYRAKLIEEKLEKKFVQKKLLIKGWRNRHQEAIL